MRKDFRQLTDFKQRHSAMLAAASAESRVPNQISHS
jgi:hypothetical protein